MIRKINIDIDQESIDRALFSKYNIDFELYDSDTISIISDLNESYIDVITNYDEIRNSINDNYKNYASVIVDDIDVLEDVENSVVDIEYLNIYKKYMNKSDKFYKDLFNNIEYVNISSSSLNDTLNYLNKNSILKTKKIILDGYYTINDDISDIKELFKDYDNIYINVKDNELPVHIPEFIEAQDKIDSMVDQIKKYNLSPLEQIMYAYDITRDRVYKKEEENEMHQISRDLSKVLLGDKIVCVGYQVIFETILNKLNINNIPYFIVKNDINIGHALNLVFIDDKKYNVKGIYYFDPTWDSKREDNNYLLGYRFFALTKNQIEKYHKELYSDETLPYINKNTIGNLKKIFEEKGISNTPNEFVKSINNISELVSGKKLIPSEYRFYDNPVIPNCFKLNINEEEILNELQKHMTLLDKPLSASVLLKVLYNVRKIEYYNNPEKYPFDINSLYKIIVNSKWLFQESGDYKLLKAIFDDVPYINQEEYINNFLNNNEYGKKIEQVKLTKLLKKIYEKKISDK